MARGKKRNRERAYHRERKGRKNIFSFEREWPRYPFNGILWFYAVVAIIGEFSIYLFHFSDDWGPFALAEGLFALCVIPDYFYNKKFGKAKKSYGLLKTGLRGLIIFITLAFIQAISRYTLTITDGEEALYYNIAPIAEELCFRGLICRVLAGNKNNPILAFLSIAVSTTLFAVMHVSYYDNPEAMAFIIGMGISLAIYYLIWKDLGAVILAHFLLNFIVSLPILYQVFL